MAEGGLSSIRYSSDADFDFTCTPCGEGNIREEAVKYCPQCQEHLCVACTRHHGRQRATRSHKLLDKSDTNQGSSVTITAKCLYHQDREIEMYCGTHDMVYCAKCIATEHRSCGEVAGIEIVQTPIDQQNGVKLVNDEIRNTQERLAALKLKKLQNIDLLEEQRYSILDKVQDIERCLMEHIRKLKAETVDVLNKTYTNTKDELLSDIKVIDDTRNDVEKSRNQLKTLSRVETSQQFVQLKLTQRSVTYAKEVIKNIKSFWTKSFSFTENIGLKTSLSTATSLGHLQLNCTKGIVAGAKDLINKDSAETKAVSTNENTDLMAALISATSLGHIRARKKKRSAYGQYKNRARERNDTKAKSAAAVALLSLAEDCENLRPDESEFQPLSDSKYVNASTQTDNRCIFDILNATKHNELSNEQKEQIDRQIEMIDKLLNMNSVLTEQSQKLRQELDRLELKMNQLQEKNKLLEEKTKRCFSADFIANDDNKTSYYTGLANYATFEVVFQHTVKHVKRKQTKLSLKDELLLTLVKLRQNCGMEDLAYRFGISAGSVTKIFHIWLNALHKSLAALVTWPPLDKEMQLPEVFQNENFCKVKCIIDCTEIFIERPSSLKARAQTYSNYKKHNTIKVLIGISPSGAVTFMSKIWGGRASDKKITTTSNIFTKLVPGNVVLADRGFNMKDDFAQHSVKLVVPVFTKGKKQLNPEDSDFSHLIGKRP